MVMREDVTSAQTSGDEGAIRGQVVDARSGLPLAARPWTLSADRSGRERLDRRRWPIRSARTEAGEYRLFVSAPGYVAAQYGQRQAAEDGTGVEVRGGQITSRVDIRLQPAAIISGRILDDAGEGLAGVEIELLAKRYGPGGASPVPMGFAQTEASGVFRVGDLQEGEYYVRAYVPAAVGRQGRRDAGVRTDIFSASSANRRGAAGSCCRRPGALRREFRSRDGQEARGQRHSGRPCRAAHRSSESHIMMLRGGTFSETARVSSNGSFEIRNVVPGDYMLQVQDAGESTRWLSATRHITVDDDVSVELVARRGARLEGRIVRESGDPLPFDPRTIEVGFEQRIGGLPGTADWVNGLRQEGRPA